MWGPAHVCPPGLLPPLIALPCPQADRDPRDNEEAVPSDDEVEEPSQRGMEGSEDEGEDLMDGMEA